MSTSTESCIAIAYEPESVPLLALAGLATRNAIGLVWVTDGADTRILRRLGTVVQVGKRSADEIADELAAIGVSGITTFADSQIERTAHIGARMDLPANTAQTARSLVNKIAQREALCEAGLPGPAFVGIASHEDLAGQDARLDDLRYPVVVKPTFGSGGRDTYLMRDPTALRAHLDARHRGGSWQSTIVEECLGVPPPSDRGGFGDYVSVEVVVAQAVPRIVTITGRMPLVEPFRETGAFLPSTLSAQEQSEVSDMAVRAARALDVRHGCLHVELKLTADGPRVIEVNGRIAGGGIPDLVTAFTGVDLFECALNSAIGRPVESRPINTNRGVHYHLALQPPIGRRVRLRPDWSPQLHDVPGVEHVALRSAEAEVGPSDGSYGYLLMASGVAVDHSALLDTYHELYGLMVVD